MPEYIRSNNGAEFAANAVRKWLNRLDVTTLFIEPRSPYENGYVESFIGKMRDELLNEEVLDTLGGGESVCKGLVKGLQLHQAHSSLGYRPPGAGGACGRKTHSRAGTMLGGRSKES
jgi:putative transposase